MGIRHYDGLAVTSVGAVLTAFVFPFAEKTGWIGVVAKIAVGVFVLVILYELVCQALFEWGFRRVSHRRDKAADE